MSVTLTLSHGPHTLTLLPSRGAATARWQVRHHEQTFDVFRPWDGVSDNLFDTGNFALLPWSNRISEGGFSAPDLNGQMQFHAIDANHPFQTMPIHGDAWLQAWDVIGQVQGATESHVTLALTSKNHQGNPFHYRAQQTFTLCEAGLRVDLTVTHLGETPMPYGLGQHPYFPRTPQTQLHAPAEGVWLAGETPVPRHHTTDLPPDWAFSTPQNLDAGRGDAASLIDNVFTGWDGQARIVWPEWGAALDISAAPHTPYFVLYRPVNEVFFCFEPVSHVNNAIHLPGHPGLVWLAQGETLTQSTTFTWSPL